MKIEFASFLAFVLGTAVHGTDLRVGPGQEFTDLNAALAKAAPGDTILVDPGYRDEHGLNYEKVAVLVRKPRITIRAAAGVGSVTLRGFGFDYSGAGPVPRAIVQFDPGSDGCVLDGFDISGAHNKSVNGAGIRINQANNITITNCSIHDNDMGIMSNGRASATPPTGDHQLIENSHIFHNGAPQNPGQNHNLYLGGTSVTLRDCEVFNSITGHNVKSRAHITRVIDCYIHDAASREFDLVDEAGNTDLPGSDALLLGNVIVKAKNSAGNRNVIHFGQDGGHDHDGTLYLVHNTIVTPYLAPVIDLSAPHARARVADNLLWDGGSGQKNQVLTKNRTGADVAGLVTGTANFFCGGFGPQGELGLSVPGDQAPPFGDPGRGDFHINKPDPRLIGQAAPVTAAQIPSELLSGLDVRHENHDIGAVILDH